MRNLMITLAALTLATACSHEPEAHSIASTPEASGGEVVTECGNGRVYFSSGSAELSNESQAQLDTYGGCLTRHETDVVYVAGTTDTEGSTDENLELGRARARAVADYLRANGCTVDFVIRSEGETDAFTSAPLWPLDRAATATAVSNPD